MMKLICEIHNDRLYVFKCVCVSLSPQVLMWSTGSFIMWKASQIVVRPVNMPATCWRPATSDTPSTKSPFLNNATMSLETSVAVSGHSLVSSGVYRIISNRKDKEDQHFFTVNISSAFLTVILRHDPPVSPWPWWVQWRSLRSGHSATSTTPRCSPLAHAPALPVPNPSPIWPATALPQWTRCWQCRKPAQWWVQFK